MAFSGVLRLMGLPQNNENNNNAFYYCNYGSTIVPDWETVTERLISHPEEALIHATHDNNDSNSFSPLYIALRNEVTPIPVQTLRILLLANPAALTDATLDMACRNPSTSSEVMNILLNARPDYYNATDTSASVDENNRQRNALGGVGVRRRGYRSWHSPLHIAAKRGRSVEAVRALIERSGGRALWVRDCCCRIPLHEACVEGSPDILRLLLVEGSRSVNILDPPFIGFGSKGIVAGGLFERDLLGLTPLECAMLKSKHLEDCYAKDIQNNSECGSGQGGGNAYYHGHDFQEKRRDAWKRLVLCVQAAAAAIKYSIPRCDSFNDEQNLSYVDNMFGTPFLQAAIEFVVWGGVDLRYDDLFYLLLHTGHCDKKASASVIDEYGRVPFHLAEEQGLTISNGLLQILSAYPEALFRKDLDVGIIPHMIAALSENFGLSMVYTMVTNAPSFFNHDRRLS